jgi:hypothetical protein
LITVHDDLIEDWDFVMGFFKKNFNLSQNKTIRLLIQQTANELRNVDHPSPEDMTIKEFWEMIGNFFERVEKVQNSDEE